MNNFIKYCCIFFLILFLSSCKQIEQKPESLLDTINKNQKFVVGVSTSAKPFGFINSKGKNDGFDIDLIKEISSRIFDGDIIVFKEVTPNNRIMELNAGEVDAIISTMTITNDRKRVISFSNPYFMAGQALLVKKNTNIYSSKDLSNKKVGVVLGTTAEQNIKFINSNADVVGFKNYFDAFIKLKEGHIDAMSADDTILYGIISDNKNFRILKERFSVELYGIAFRKDSASTQLKENVNIALKTIENDGTLEKLKKKWGIDIRR